MAVTTFKDLPLADRDRAWDGITAKRWVRSWAGAADGPQPAVPHAYVWSVADSRTTSRRPSCSGRRDRRPAERAAAGSDGRRRRDGRRPRAVWISRPRTATGSRATWRSTTARWTTVPLGRTEPLPLDRDMLLRVGRMMEPCPPYDRYPRRGRCSSTPAAATAPCGSPGTRRPGWWCCRCGTATCAAAPSGSRSTRCPTLIEMLRDGLDRAYDASLGPPESGPAEWRTSSSADRRGPVRAGRPGRCAPPARRGRARGRGGARRRRRAGLAGIAVGDRLELLTWLHLGRPLDARDVPARRHLAAALRRLCDPVARPTRTRSACTP